MIAWWRNLSRFSKLCGYVAAISGMVVSLAAAWPLVEWAVPAHRGFVAERIGGVQVPLIELQIWRHEDAKAKARSEAADWSIKLPKEQDPQTRSMIERRIEQLKGEEHAIDERIRKLKGQ